jgi:hypothetical protein
VTGNTAEAAETLEPCVRLIRTMREQRNLPEDVGEEMEPDPPTSMCCAFMDTLTSMDLLMLSDAVRCSDEEQDTVRVEPGEPRRKALRSR